MSFHPTHVIDRRFLLLFGIRIFPVFFHGLFWLKIKFCCVRRMNNNYWFLFDFWLCNSLSSFILFFISSRSQFKLQFKLWLRKKFRTYIIIEFILILFFIFSLINYNQNKDNKVTNDGEKMFEINLLKIKSLISINFIYITFKNTTSRIVQSFSSFVKLQPQAISFRSFLLVMQACQSHITRRQSIKLHFI